MSKTFSTDRAYQKRHFVRSNKKNYECDKESIYAVIERSFQVDAVRYGNQRKAKSRAKVEQRRLERRRFNQFEE